MRSKKHKTTGSNDLFRRAFAEFRIINLKHELALLAGKARLIGTGSTQEIALYSENGRPGIETRFMIALLLLKQHGLSDEVRALGPRTRIWPLHWRGSSSSTPSRTSAAI